MILCIFCDYICIAVMRRHIFMTPLRKIILVKPQGFCAGVERAVKTVDVLLDTYGPPLYVRHHIVHNDHVIQRLEKRGAIFIEDLQSVPKGSRIVFSAHGSPPNLYQEAQKRGLQVIDATCPLVVKVHQEAMRYARGGYFILYIGHKDHPETVGVMEEVPKEQISLVESISDISRLHLHTKKVAILNQTTLSVDDTKEIVELLKKRFPSAVTPTGKDICYATQNRQDAVKALAKIVDLVLVVGSPASSNSNRLRDMAEKNKVPAYLINDKTEIQSSWLKSVRTLGITSGASVPEHLVHELVRFLSHPKVQVEELELADESQIHFSLPKELLVT